VFRIIVAFVVLFAVGCHRVPDFAKVGGTKLTYQIDVSKSKVDPETAEEAMTRRLDPTSRFGIKVHVENGKLEISIPAGEGHGQRVEYVKRISTAIAELNFQILADNTDRQLAAAVLSLAPEDTSREVVGNEEVLGRWLPVATDAAGAPNVQLDQTNFTRQSNGSLETLLRISPFDIQGKHLKNVAKGYDESMRPSLNFSLTERGSKMMRALTKTNLNRRLAIILDGKIVSAPAIRSEISDRGQITGDFTEQYVKDMVAILRVGGMPFTLTDDPPTAEQVSAK